MGSTCGDNRMPGLAGGEGFPWNSVVNTWEGQGWVGQGSGLDARGNGKSCIFAALRNSTLKNRMLWEDSSCIDRQNGLDKAILAVFWGTSFLLTSGWNIHSSNTSCLPEPCPAWLQEHLGAFGPRSWAFRAQSHSLGGSFRFLHTFNFPTGRPAFGKAAWDYVGKPGLFMTDRQGNPFGLQTQSLTPGHMCHLVQHSGQQKELTSIGAPWCRLEGQGMNPGSVWGTLRSEYLWYGFRDWDSKVLESGHSSIACIVMQTLFSFSEPQVPHP